MPDSVYNVRNLLLKHNLSKFIHRSFQTLKPGEEYHHNWHIDAIAEYLEAVKDGHIRRLIINMPPRSLKSIAVTVAFPAWIMGNDPTKSLICSSYAADLSIQHSVDCRMVMESEWFREVFPACELSKDQNAKGKYRTTLNGTRFSTSTGGAATGMGADYIICDDPLNPKQAASEKERLNANTFMDATLPTRLNNKDKGAIIVVMQRLHEDDVTGHLLAKNAGWEHLCLPAKNDRDRIISIGNFEKEFKEKELLHPTRLSQKILDELNLDLGSNEFAGQYLQQPVPKGGGILKSNWWREWTKTTMPHCEFVLQVYDTAFKDGSMNDYSARTTWGIFTDTNDNSLNILLLEAMNKRLSLPELREEVVQSYKEYNPDLVLVEDKASGISLIQELKRLRIRIRPLARGKGDNKISRAHIASVMLEQGVVWYPKDKAWAIEVIRQCASFPNAKHDDLVDTVSDALIYLRNYKRISVGSDPAWEGRVTNDFKPRYGGHYG